MYVPDIVPTVDPALAAVRALVAAAPGPLAVFDATGECLVANPAFVAHAAAEGARGEVRTPFRPDGTRVWTLASVSKDAARGQSQFLVGMGHELRTPLNAVIGFAEILKEEALGPLGAPEYHEYATLILRSGLSLLDLIATMLDVARADAGALALSLGNVEVTRLLRSVAAGTRDEMAAATGKAQASVEVGPCVGTIGIRADEHRLRQLLRAVVGRALKVTPPDGQVRIAVQAPPGGGVQVVVTDTGIGLAPEAMERGGAAIGLKLARRLAELHGGSLTLEGGKGQGTRAVLTLPQAPPA